MGNQVQPVVRARAYTRSDFTTLRAFVQRVVSPHSRACSMRPSGSRAVRHRERRLNRGALSGSVQPIHHDRSDIPAIRAENLFATDTLYRHARFAVDKIIRNL